MNRRRARRLNRRRRGLLKKVARGIFMPGSNVAAAAAKGLRRDARRTRRQLASLNGEFGAASANGGIDWSRVQVKRSGRHDESPVFVTAIRKVSGASMRPGIQSMIASYGATMGYDAGGSPDLLDVFAADLHRVDQGWSAPMAMGTLQQHTDSEDWYRGDEYPLGDEAPFPPPRRPGPEVQAG